MMKDENHIFHSVKNEPSHTVEAPYNRAQPLSALQPQSSSEQVTRNNLPVIIYNSQIRLYRHNNISQSNYLDSSFSLTTSRHESRNRTTVNSQMTENMIEQQEYSFTFVYQKPFIQHALPSNFQIEWPVNITLFCNCGPDNNNMLLTGSRVASFATIKQWCALEGGIPSQHVKLCGRDNRNTAT